jgi:hypothetical protein
MRLVLCSVLLVLVACLGLHATAQQPTSPGTLAVGQVFTGQYDDFTTFGDNIVIKIVASDGTVLRFNGIGLHFYYHWYNYRALRDSFEGQRCVPHSFVCQSDVSTQRPSSTTSPATGSLRTPAPAPTLLVTSLATSYASPEAVWRVSTHVLSGRCQACSWYCRYLQNCGSISGSSGGWCSRYDRRRRCAGAHELQMVCSPEPALMLQAVCCSRMYFLQVREFPAFHLPPLDPRRHDLRL